jgi:hypothetical protein
LSADLLRRAFVFVGIYIGNSSPNIYFHYYDYIDYTFIMSTAQEGLGEHTRGLATPEREVFCPTLVRRLGDKDPYIEKALKIKTSMPRKP